MYNELPFVSILLPVRNEADYIESCLAAVLSQDYPKSRIEILVADGMSTDSTRIILNMLKSQHVNLQVFDNFGEIAPIGLNLLIHHAKGKIIIRLDGHTVISPDYVSNCVHRIQSDDLDVVGGPMMSVGEGFFAETIAVATSTYFGVGDSIFRTKTGPSMLVDTVPFPAFKREIIDEVGLYDEEMLCNEDDEYNYRIRKLGGKILLADNVRSTYFSRSSLKKLWTQYFRYGLWKVRVLQKHPRQMRLRQFVPPAFVLALITSILLTFFTSFGWMPLAGLVGVYLLVTLIVSVVTAKNKGWQYLWLLPFAFATLHISYGLGFLIGLVKFLNRF